MKKHIFKPDLPPPQKTHGLIYWLKKNLFYSFTSGIISIILSILVIYNITIFLNWALINADWLGSTKAQCNSSGACWIFILVRIQQFIYGFYPDESIWRVNVFFALSTIFFILILSKTPNKIKIFSILTYPILSFIILYGGFLGLVKVDTHLWGGLLITIVIAVSGIIVSLPLGIILALGRRSKMPIIRSISIIYIEFWRGVPLITVLFMASVMLPLFLNSGTEIDKLSRALIGVILFSSAYMAEVIRGGLQAIPKGQYEASSSLGLTYWKTNFLIIIPQALKISIPSIVNTFIGLFKDTSLVLIIGMFDVLGIGQAANNDPNWLGFSTESYLFVGMIFWFFCFIMSRYSHYLEKKLDTNSKK
ncbi:amino acid ABC transporter permease [Paraphotobacterium marinum]|uniref:amino acid ABC transporter permease n=1 Tax=Paraphotobacterium marinum TaxID=1755811 RepID=UPI0039EA60F8